MGLTGKQIDYYSRVTFKNAHKYKVKYDEWSKDGHHVVRQITTYIAARSRSEAWDKARKSVIRLRSKHGVPYTVYSVAYKPNDL